MISSVNEFSKPIHHYKSNWVIDYTIELESIREQNLEDRCYCIQNDSTYLYDGIEWKLEYNGDGTDTSNYPKLENKLYPKESEEMY